MELPDDLVDAIEGLALAAAVAGSAHPASEALSVPGEPRIVSGTILNCIRFPVSDDDALPDFDDAILATDDEDNLSIDPECHFVNIHDAAGRWRVDFSFHYVCEDDNTAAGVAGVLVMDSTRVAAKQIGEVVQRIDLLRELLLSANAVHDPRWENESQTTLH